MIGIRQFIDLHLKEMAINSEKILREILFKKNNKNLTRKVDSYIQKFMVRMNSLTALDKDVRTYFLQLHYHATRKQIKIHFENEVEYFLLNVIAGKYRNELKKI